MPLNSRRIGQKPCHSTVNSHSTALCYHGELTSLFMVISHPIALLLIVNSHPITLLFYLFYFFVCLFVFWWTLIHYYFLGEHSHHCPFHNIFFLSPHPRWDLTPFRSFCFALKSYHLWDSITTAKKYQRHASTPSSCCTRLNTNFAPK